MASTVATQPGTRSVCIYGQFINNLTHTILNFSVLLLDLYRFRLHKHFASHHREGSRQLNHVKQETVMY